MKRFRLLYYILLSVLFTLTACHSDLADDPTAPVHKGYAKVKINVSPAASMRAAYNDQYADKDEMMNIWTVVIVNGSGDVMEIQSCIPDEENREIDNLTELPVGTYTFYSFANIGAAELEKLLGFDTGTIPVPTTSHEISRKTDLTDVKFTSEQADDATISIDGNFFNPSSDNDFGSKGIPMSNIQNIEVKESTVSQTINLIVVRLLAKIELQLYNDDVQDITIEKITLTDITDYKQDRDNLKLFPKYTSTTVPNGPNLMDRDNYEHGDIHPNLNGTPAVTNLNIIPNPSSSNVKTTFGDTWTVSATANNTTKEPIKITFYVNESENPKGENWGQINDTYASTQKFNHFFLKIALKHTVTVPSENGEESTTKQKDEVRYALIDINKDGEDEWNYIARNDYRIIPIVLDDYGLDMIPYDFPAIGVLPASVKEEDGIYTINFHDYGHFHLQPKVTRYSDGSLIPYGKRNDGETYWTLANSETSFTDNCESWTSWADATKPDTPSFNENDFYRTGDDPKITDGIDGDEKGGVPVWYENGGTSWKNPQWASDWAPATDPELDYQPFIFGYIEDPGSSITNGDKKVYHEFTINLYKNGTGNPRQMTYRLYMILDTSQMLYPNRNNGAPRVRHPHCLH